ncbi:hypothetical protein [Dethiothermospora halolimnae]|uniref:hypothetical protein n=1 Tax=Dethiothermospora halolimnae TaxID=3114390 RepID=UPI003CCBC4FF
MKKMILGGLLFIGAMIGILGIFIFSGLNPGIYYSFSGLLGSLLVTGAIIPLFFFIIMALIGIIICMREAYSEG